MTTNNKVSFALFSASFLIIALAAIGLLKFGMDQVLFVAMCGVASFMIEVALILWWGIGRLLRYTYLMLVFAIVILCVSLVVAVDDIAVWIGAGVVAVIAVASLIPIVFKSNNA